MQTKVTFRHMKSNPELQTMAEESSAKFGRFYDDITGADIVFTNESHTQKVTEFTVQVNGATLIVKEDSQDFIKSLRDGTDKMIRQLRKWKTKNSKN